MDKMKEVWQKAEQTGEPVDIGDLVVCDYCSTDYTNSTESGGLIFESKGICPKCAPRTMESIKRYKEERFVRAICPPEKSFAEFVREYRGSNNYIHIQNI